MSQKAPSSCPHVNTVGDNTWEDVYRKKQIQTKCDSCHTQGPNLWVCLHTRCLYVGCGESGVDHSAIHSERERHYLTLNLTTLRIWCYDCECEVFKEGNDPPLVMRDRSLSLTPLSEPVSPERRIHAVNPIRLSSPTHSHCSSHASQPATPLAPEEDSDTDEESDNEKPRGLTGLQNIGNTCYMNAAIQALSNCPPLTRFLLDCPGFVRTDKKPLLAKSYMKLMIEMWHKKRPSYVVPSSVSHGIKIVHPMFRGYTQQDSQEFLRCFMDQIHEELKQPKLRACADEDNDDYPAEPEPAYDTTKEIDSISANQQRASEAPDAASQSDAEYETCDSGLSSERSSMEHNLAMDDGVESIGEGGTITGNIAACRQSQSDSALHSRTRLDPLVRGDKHRTKKEKNRVNPDDSGISSSGSTTTISSHSQTCSVEGGMDKQAKDTANTHRHSKDEGRQPADGDSAEFSDAVSELEPLQSQGQSSKVMAWSKSVGEKSSPPPRQRHTSETERMKALSIQSPGPGARTGVRKPAEYQSVISDIFDGKILSSVQCLTCERVSATKETFQDLSLPIPNKDHLHMLHAQQGPGNPISSHKGTCAEVTLNQGWFSWMFGWMKSWFWGPTVTLQDCLAAFFSADELKGDNMYSCEKCKKLRNGVKYSKVMELPEILCIHLKRFRHEFMFSTKICTYVSFPLEGLDMGPYLHKDCSDQITMYDLVSVICHHGTAGGGHYTSYALNYVNAQWYEFDDQYVTEVDLPQVDNCEAYVLFYRKRNEQMLQLRQKAQQIMEVQEESSFMNFYISKQWINQFNTFAEPGPITNHDFLCRHGGVHPHKWAYVGDLVEEVSQKLWEFLHENFGGGPAVNHLYQCTTCQMELERLKRRQKFEMDTFMQLHKAFQNDETSGTIYAISMAWFREWENFVRGRAEEAPGPIDNSKISVVKVGQASIKMNSDYGQLSEELWQFMLDIYGGGPELVLRRNDPHDDPQQDKHGD